MSHTLLLELEFMFIESEKQEDGPTHQQADVLQEKHETRSVGLHSIHLWKLKKGENDVIDSCYKNAG